MDEENRGETSGAIADAKIIHTYPLIRHSDMPEDIKNEALEICVTACEKFSNSNELAAKMIKDHLDKKFGGSFHVVVGEAFGFEVSYQLKTILYMYFSGNLGCVLWKCA